MLQSPLYLILQNHFFDCFVPLLVIHQIHWKIEPIQFKMAKHYGTQQKKPNQKNKN